jgi:hypothetical protein
MCDVASHHSCSLEDLKDSICGVEIAVVDL